MDVMQWFVESMLEAQRHHKDQSLRAAAAGLNATALTEAKMSLHAMTVVMRTLIKQAADLSAQSDADVSATRTPDER